MRTAILTAFALALMLHGASAQAPLGSGTVPSAPTAISPAPSTGPSKGAACREAARGSGVRGAELQDQVAICVAEAHLDCLKQAIAQKIRGSQRQPFIKSCMGR